MYYKLINALFREFPYEKTRNQRHLRPHLTIVLTLVCMKFPLVRLLMRWPSSSRTSEPCPLDCLEKLGHTAILPASFVWMKSEIAIVVNYS